MLLSTLYVQSVVIFLNLSLSRSHSKVKGSRTIGRIGNMPSHFGVFILISQNIMIVVSHVLKDLMKKIKISPCDEIENSQK